MNERLRAFARKTLKSDLAKCTEEQQAKFLTTFTYVTTPKPKNIIEAVDRMPDEELEHTMDVVSLLVEVAKIERADQVVNAHLSPPREFHCFSTSAFDLLVQAFYGHVYEFSADEEVCIKVFEGIGNPLDEWDQKELDKFKAKGVYQCLGRILLNDLANHNMIPAGDYIIRDGS